MEKTQTPFGSTDTGANKLKYDYLVKVKMVGDSNAGKSSIVIRFCEDSFTDNTMPTIGKALLILTNFSNHQRI